MKKEISNRVLEEAKQIIKRKITIREVSKEFGVSKSTVHKDLQERLLEIDPKKHKLIADIMQEHIEIRHIRGGESTKKKYRLKH